MLFWIPIAINQKAYTLKVERIVNDELTEQFKVSSKSNTIVLETDRPFFRKRGLKHRKPHWTVVEGEYKNSSTLDKIIEALMNAIE